MKTLGAASTWMLLLLPIRGQSDTIRDQAWIDSQRILLQRERALQDARKAEFRQAAQDGLKESISHLLDWIPVHHTREEVD
jgi:hypothetical protein